MKKSLLKTLDWVNDPKIRDFYRCALENAPAEFWTAPSSSSNKYHPPENNKEGGLANVHTLKVASIAFELAEHEHVLLPLEEKNKLRDIVVVAAGCHDMKKGGDPWNRYDKYHGTIAANWLEQFPLLDKDAKEKIKEAVKYHMNRLHFPEEERATALNPNRPSHVRIVQYADIIASRTAVSFLPGISLPDDFIGRYNEDHIESAREMFWEREE